MSETLETLAARAVAGDRAALERLAADLLDDVYHLALRMTGLRAEAEDAAQEILIQVITHLGQFRGESSLRTWVWKIATRHLGRLRRGKREQVATFENIEQLISEGDKRPPLPELAEAELAVLEDEVRLACTEAMVLALDRDHRMAWILTEVFGLDGEEGAAVVDVPSATFRKRVSRARERLREWLAGKCGLADAAAACNCRRQIPVAIGFGVVDPNDLQYAKHPAGRRLAVLREADAIERTAEALRTHPDYAAPDRLRHAIGEIIGSGHFRMFDA
jgi:RNA polymerase sigma factor (sigma-70 family)